MFVCDDTGVVRGHMAKREEIGDDDLVGLYLDTFNDRRHAYAFEVNPLGLQRDGLMNEGQKTDYTFDAVWTTDGRLTEKGFVVWMAIPFKSLRFSNADVQTWGIALRRKILRTNEEAYWPFITQRVSGFINQMAPLEDISEVSVGPQRAGDSVRDVHGIASARRRRRLRSAPRANRAAAWTPSS